MLDRSVTRPRNLNPTVAATPVSASVTAGAAIGDRSRRSRCLSRDLSRDLSRCLSSTGLRPGHLLSQMALLGSLVGLGTGLSLVGQGLRPAAVLAYEARATVTIDHGTGESYNSLLRRAEAVGRAAAQRTFDNDILVTEVLIFVNAQKQGMEAPLLAIQASRFQWHSLPDPRQWAIYYSNTRSLLGLEYSVPDAPATATLPGLGQGSFAIESPGPGNATSPSSTTANNPGTALPGAASVSPIFSSPIFNPTANPTANPAAADRASAGADLGSPSSRSQSALPAIAVPAAGPATGATAPLSLPTADPITAPDPAAPLLFPANPDAAGNADPASTPDSPLSSDLPNPFSANLEGSDPANDSSAPQ